MIDLIVIPLIKIVIVLTGGARHGHVPRAARAQGAGVGPGAPGADAGRAARRAAADRRRAEAVRQGRHHAGPRRQVGVHAGADHRAGAGDHRVRRDPVRRLGEHLRQAGPALHRRPERRSALHRGGGVDRHLRHHPRRLVVELEVPAARRAAVVGAAHQLRGGGDADVRERHPRVRQPEHGGHHRRAEGQRRVVRVRAAGGALHLRGGRRWPRRTGRRSTCRKPSRSWWPGSTPSTAGCGSRCSSWPNTRT